MKDVPRIARLIALACCVLLLPLGVGLHPAAAQILMNGAGATFPYPIYSKWFDEYAKMHPQIRFNYQAIGSGGGIEQTRKQTVDFGASDAPELLYAALPPAVVKIDEELIRSIIYEGRPLLAAK